MVVGEDFELANTALKWRRGAPAAAVTVAALSACDALSAVVWRGGVRSFILS